jgi:hypothetical protein
VPGVTWGKLADAEDWLAAVGDGRVDPVAAIGKLLHEKDITTANFFAGILLAGDYSKEDIKGFGAWHIEVSESLAQSSLNREVKWFLK